MNVPLSIPRIECGDMLYDCSLHLFRHLTVIDLDYLS